MFRANFDADGTLIMKIMKLRGVGADNVKGRKRGPGNSAREIMLFIGKPTGRSLMISNNSATPLYKYRQACT